MARAHATTTNKEGRKAKAAANAALNDLDVSRSEPLADCSAFSKLRISEVRASPLIYMESSGA